MFNILLKKTPSHLRSIAPFLKYNSNPYNFRHKLILNLNNCGCPSTNKILILHSVTKDSNIFGIVYLRPLNTHCSTAFISLT
jgi:hypothetical protein